MVTYYGMLILSLKKRLNILFRYGNCRRVTNEQQCDVGLRKKIYHIVSGSVLSIWSTIEQVIPNMQSRLQIVRLKMSDGVRVIGAELI